MTTQQQLIWDYLVKNALGKINIKQISEIANAIGAIPKGTNNDDVRASITDMVINHQKPIGTLSTGAFIILNDAEREEAAKFVERNTKAHAIRNNGNYIP